MSQRMERFPEKLLFGLILFLLHCSCPICSKMGLTMVTLDSKQVCVGLTVSDVYWASKEKAVVVVGRGAEDRQMFIDCGITIGAATAEAGVLQLDFEAFHIGDCGVTLVVNQSNKSDFSSGNTLMAKIGCNHGNIRVLHSQEKHFVRISVHKQSALLQKYNFRINITVTEKKTDCSDVDLHQSSSESDMGLESVTDIPISLGTNYMDSLFNGSLDKLPETGPETHVVIIVGVVVLFVVSMSLWLLVKYLIHHSQRWHEQQAERNMEQAIRLYNNQESPPESDYMYTALPPQEVSQVQAAPPAGRSHRGQSNPSSNKTASNRSGRHRTGDITFVHADGHIERFRMRDSPQERRSLESLSNFATHTARSAQSVGLARDRDTESVHTFQNGEDMLGECPPSYEEALQMPMPSAEEELRSPEYVNINTEKNDSSAN